MKHLKLGSSIPPSLVTLLIRIRILPLNLRTQQSPLPQILPHDAIHTAHIVFRLPHIVQPRPPCPLLSPLNNLNSRHTRAVNLKPHFHSHTRQVVPEQDCRINAPFTNADTHACEGFARGRPHKQDVTYFGGFRVCGREEPGTATGGIELGELSCLEGPEGFFACGAEGGWCWVDGDGFVDFTGCDG